MALEDAHLEGLHAALDRAFDVRAASQAAVDHLASVPGWLPSLYLLRGGRLRCAAAHGYWQVRDGFAPGAGVLGRTLRAGEPMVVHDVSRSTAYLEAIPDVLAEICVPIRLGDQVAGVLNVESTAALGDEVLDQMVAIAALYADRLGELGGPPAETPAERLARHAGRLAGLTEVEEIERLLVDAARDVTAMDSAVLLCRDALGRPDPRHATGPLSGALEAGTSTSLAVIESCVASGTSCYTVSERGDQDLQGMHVLAHGGVEALLAVQVVVSGAPWGVLLVAHRHAHAPTSEVVGLVELLAAQVGSALRTAQAIAELRDRAARDPLTGLGHHATFHDALAAARGPRGGVAVLLADVDGFKTINDRRGHQAGDRVLREIASALSAALRRGDRLFRIGGDEFAALVAVADEAEALDVGRRLREAASQVGSVTVSVGVAMLRPGESDASVLARADRALYAVKDAGRDGVALGD